MDDSGLNKLIYLNGLRGDAAGYLVEPFTLDALRDRAYQFKLKPGEAFGSQANLNALKNRGDQSKSFGLPADAVSDDISSTGWGIIFPAEADSAQVDAILEALTDLTTLRQGQAGKRFQLYRGGDGYRPDDSGDSFLARHGVQPGTPDVDHVPYYLLIVADPQSIPFSFQYELDVQYAVGRIYFETLDEYASYARSVLLSETPGKVALARQASFFGVANPGDAATNLSAANLVQPLYQYVLDKHDKLGWNAPELVAPADATKANLARRLGGDLTPALLFSASHGLGWPYGHEMQVPFQGSLVCQDWPGPAANVAPDRNMYFGAEDIDSQASLLGSVAFFFACFGGGTPYWDDYAVAQNKSSEALAHRAFLASLPRRMLGHPRGGALAVIAHVERAWGYSFNWPGTDAEPATFKNVLYQIMQGLPVGFAMEFLNVRYAQIATMLSKDFEDVRYDPNFNSYQLSNHWLANNDARGYAILGDPAVKIPMAPAGVSGAARQAIDQPAHRPGSLPVVLVLDSVPAGELPAVQAEMGKASPAPAAPASSLPGAGQPGASAAGGKTFDVPVPAGAAAPQAPQMGETPPPVEGSKPPVQEIIQAGAGAPGDLAPRPQAASPQAGPPASALDGLAMALAAYNTPGKVSFAIGADGALSFNIIDDAKKMVSGVVANLNTVLDNISKRLVAATNEVLTLEVTTSLVDDLDSFDPMNPGGIIPRARFKTTISATGDIKVYLPNRADPIDAVLLQVQRDMVHLAMTNRTETIEAIGLLVANLFSPIPPK